MRRLPLLAATPLIAASLIAGGCGGSSSSGGGSARAPVNPNGPEANPPGDIPDNQAFVEYAPPGGGFAVKVPEGWARTSVRGATIFTDKLNSVRMEVAPASTAPTVASARAKELPKIAAGSKRFQAGKVTTVTRNAGTAVKISYLADSAPDPVSGKVTRDAVERYEFFKRGRQAVLTLAGPKGADNVDPWKIVTDSFRWTR